VLKKFLRKVQNEFVAKVKIRSDNDTEFKNTQVENFVDEEDIKHEFLAPYTPQQNEHRTLDWFWAEAVNEACYTTNRLYLHKLLKRTSYELLTGNKPNAHTSKFSKVSAIFYKRDQSLLNLLLRLMKISYLVMIQTLVHTVLSM
jgi:hypothetical protein